MTNNADTWDHGLRARAATRTRELLSQALVRRGSPGPGLEIRFDLRGRAAGQARYRPRGPWVIRYNLALLLENPDSFIAETVPHEVAHLVAFLRHGPRIRPHGAEWRAVMGELGAVAERCHRYDLSRIPKRKTRVFPYHCACGSHELTSIRHHRAQAGRTYLCRRCAEPLRPGRQTPASTSGRPSGNADLLRFPSGPGMVRQSQAPQVPETVAFQGSHPLEGELSECPDGIGSVSP